jgi:hypothetical protein
MAAGRATKPSDGKLPPHVMVYFAMAMALFAEEDSEEVAARLTETLASWGCWDRSWAMPTSGGITRPASVWAPGFPLDPGGHGMLRGRRQVFPRPAIAADRFRRIDTSAVSRII